MQIIQCEGPSMCMTIIVFMNYCKINVVCMFCTFLILLCVFCVYRGPTVYMPIAVVFMSSQISDSLGIAVCYFQLGHKIFIACVSLPGLATFI